MVAGAGNDPFQSHWGEWAGGREGNRDRRRDEQTPIKFGASFKVSPEHHLTRLGGSLRTRVASWGITGV